MALRLVFLGRLADAAGVPEREVTPAATLAEVLGALEPALADSLAAANVRIAVNGVLVADRAAVALADGDELAFLPPVSGG